MFQYLSSPRAPNIRYVLEKLESEQESSSIVEIDNKSLVAKLTYGELNFLTVGENVSSQKVVFDTAKLEEQGGSDSESSDDESDQEDLIDNGSEHEREKPHLDETTTAQSINRSSNQLLYFTFLQRLIQVMENYLHAPLSVAKIETNSDVLMLLLQEMLDSERPYITDINQLRELLPNRSLLGKILSTTQKLSQTAQQTLNRSNNDSQAKAESSPKSTLTMWDSQADRIPWRRSNVRHTNNELYVDMTERLSVLIAPSKALKTRKKNLSSAYYSSYSDSGISQNQRPLKALIDGQINFTSHLSGVPNLQLVLDTRNHDLGVPSFHKSVQIDQYLESKGVLSFIPPDGQFVLMNYQIDLLNSNHQNAMNHIGLVSAEFHGGLGPDANEFEIKLMTFISKTTKAIDNLKVEIVLADALTKRADDPFASSVMEGDEELDEEAGEEENLIVKPIRLTHGELQVSADSKGNYEWCFDKFVSPGIYPVFRASLHRESELSSSSSKTSLKTLEPNLIDANQRKPLKPKYIRLSYEHKGALPSQMKVDSLRVLSAKGLGDKVKPFKGVKYFTHVKDFVLR